MPGDTSALLSTTKPFFLVDYNTVDEEAEQLGVTIKTLGNWRRDKAGPPFCVIAGRIYYYRPSTVKWLRDQERIPNPSKAARDRAERGADAA